MQRFAARQLDAAGDPVFYLIEYDVNEQAGIFRYTGVAYATNDSNQPLGPEQEAFAFTFEREGGGWSVITKIVVTSKLGDDIAQKIRATFFNDLVLAGIMGAEQQKN